MELYATNWSERTDRSLQQWDELPHRDPTEKYTWAFPQNPEGYKRIFTRVVR
jgi:hypothetical protein